MSNLQKLIQKNSLVKDLINELGLTIKQENEWKDKFYNMLQFVKKVRDKQKEYFDTRDKEVLQESKKLEQDLDKAVEVYLSTQTTLDI